jgi:hypothetical protein
VLDADQQKGCSSPGAQLALEQPMVTAMAMAMAMVWVLMVRLA